MKKCFTLGLAIAFCSISMAQSVDDILTKYVDSLGGKEKMAALSSLKMVGSMSAQGLDIPITMSKAKGKGVRIEFEVMGSSNYQLATPTKGWIYMPVQGMQAPEEMQDEMLKGMQSQMDITGPLVEYKSKGYAIELAGSEKVDGTDAFKLKVAKDNNESYYYISKNSYRIVKLVAKRGDAEMETTFSDYKMNKDGYWFAYTVTSIQGPITFSTIETNVTLPDALFSN